MTGLFVFQPPVYLHMQLNTKYNVSFTGRMTFSFNFFLLILTSSTIYFPEHIAKVKSFVMYSVGDSVIHLYFYQYYHFYLQTVSQSWQQKCDEHFYGFV